MSSNPHINQVRLALLDTLADLRNRETPMDIERARAVATVAGVLVDSAKVENEYLKITSQSHSTFLETPPDDILGIPHSDGPAAHNPFPTSVRHRLQG